MTTPAYRVGEEFWLTCFPGDPGRLMRVTAVEPDGTATVEVVGPAVQPEPHPDSCCADAVPTAFTVNVIDLPCRPVLRHLPTERN